VTRVAALGRSTRQRVGACCVTSVTSVDRRQPTKREERVKRGCQRRTQGSRTHALTHSRTHALAHTQRALPSPICADPHAQATTASSSSSCQRDPQRTHEWPTLHHTHTHTHTHTNVRAHLDEAVIIVASCSRPSCAADSPALPSARPLWLPQPPCSTDRKLRGRGGADGASGVATLASTRRALAEPPPSPAPLSNGPSDVWLFTEEGPMGSSGAGATRRPGLVLPLCVPP
jgi:hypothetical protein